MKTNKTKYIRIDFRITEMDSIETIMGSLFNSLNREDVIVDTLISETVKDNDASRSKQQSIQAMERQRMISEQEHSKRVSEYLEQFKGNSLAYILEAGRADRVVNKEAKASSISEYENGSGNNKIVLKKKS